MTRDEMQMKVLSPFSKSDRVHALTSGDLLHETTRITYSATPLGGFRLREIQGSGAVAQ